VLLGAASRSRRRASDGGGGLLTTVGAEVAVAAIVVGLTATLVARPPARDVARGPVAREAAIGGGDVQLVVDPARAGSNTIHLYFLSATGQVRPVDAAELRAGTASIPPRKLQLFPAGPGHFAAYDAALSPAGTWTFAVTAVTNGAADTATMEVLIR
jgi:copper transport protein